MKLLLASALVALALASDVLEFTDSDFSTKIKEHDIVLVEFFAPWCGHCKKLAPEYEKAATQLVNSDPPVALAKVDCTANTAVCGKYDVSGYPTLKIFRNGEFAEDYNGPRETDGIVKTMKSKSGPSSRLLENVAAAEKFLSFPEVGVVGFFSSEDTDLAKSFRKAADSLSEKFRFAHTVSAEVATNYGYENTVVLFYPSILHNKFEDQRKKYTGDSNLMAMKSFITENAFGLCGHRTPGNSDQFSKRPLVVVYYDVDYVKNAKGTNYWRNRVMKVAKKLVDDGKKISFSVSNAADFGQELEEFGLKYENNNPVVAIRDLQEQKFPMTQAFSLENFESFVGDFLDGKLEPYLKSEPVPDNSDNAVKVVVAKNFNDIVNNKDKDVLIEFYAPWCGHCKSLEPKYKELAEKLADEPGITIAKMDATANDVPAPYSVRGFPTIFYAPKGNKSDPKKYEGGREIEDFIKYLARESTEELKGYDRKGKAKKTEL